MNPIKNVWYSLKFDLTRNYWLYKDKHSKYHGVALMFHHVTDDFVDINESCKCRVNLFEEVLLDYLNNGYQYVSIDEALKIIRERSSIKFVIVTFDDIPDSVYTNAYPILKRLNIPFTIFITPGFIEKESFITSKHLAQLASEPLCTIGAHTMTHPMLRNVINYEWELEESRLELEKIIGRNVKYLAYPFGQYSSISKKIRLAAEKSGFECAFCTISTPLNEVSTKDFFFLPRFSPTPDKDAIKKYKFTFIRAAISLVLWPVKQIKRFKQKV